MTVLAMMVQTVAEQKEFKLELTTHLLPLWFLIFALFLPRVALAVGWFQGVLVPFHLVGIVPLLFAIVLPRLLVMYLIYLDQGLSGWLFIHVVAALMVVAGSGSHRARRRRRRDDL